MTVLAHAADAGIVGSPLYDMLPEHVPALLAVGVVPIAALWVRHRGATRVGWARRMMAGYRSRPAVQRFVVWTLAISASIHVGLVFGHTHDPKTALFVLDAGALVLVGWRLVHGRPWRLWAGLVLSGSIVSYAVTRFAGDPPDQIGMATKVVELVGLAVVLTPEPGRRLRRLAGSAAVVSLVLLTGMAAWAGSFIVLEGGDGHHGGGFAAPGTLLRSIGEREPTDHEQAAADAFYADAVRGLARYGDPAVAARAGYQVDGLAGIDFHAGNPTFQSDGRIFDPARPESLLYAQTGRGPVLLGALYEVPSLEGHGPAIGGPLTEWHAHENVCVSLLPPALSGLVSPFGQCAVGAIAIPVTNEMIHVWVVPGAPQHFGDLDPGWLETYLESNA
jgi:hypothetical protein